MTDNAERLAAKRWIESRPHGYALSASDLSTYAAMKVASRDTTIADLTKQRDMQAEEADLYADMFHKAKETIADLERQAHSIGTRLLNAEHAIEKVLQERDAARDYATEQAGYRLAAEDKVADLERRLAEACTLLQSCADKLCHYATDYPQPDTLSFINKADKMLARGHYSRDVPTPAAEASGEPRPFAASPAATVGAESANAGAHSGRTTVVVTTDPTADHTERAQQTAYDLVMKQWRRKGYRIQGDFELIERELATALTAAERAGAEKQRSLLPCGHVAANIGDAGLCEACQDIAAVRQERRVLDETVIKAAHTLLVSDSSDGVLLNALSDALAARDATHKE